MVKRRQPISDADQALLTHTCHFGLTVVEAAAKLPVFSGHEPRVVQRALQRLESLGLLASTWLYAGRRCFYPIQSESHLRRAAARGLSEETKIRRFAMLSFCCLGTVLRT